MRLAYHRSFLTEPLAAALERRGWDVRAFDDPGEELVAGRADVVVGLALDYARGLGAIDYALVPGFAITARGFAGVMTIAFRPGLETISSLAVKSPNDAATMTAAILLMEKHDIEPALVEVGSDADLSLMLDAADCALLEGDDAVFAPPGLSSQLDLADEWEDMTEVPLPYVLAWGVVGQVPQAALDEFIVARDEAVLSLPDYAVQSRNPEGANRVYQAYLRGDIRFELTPEEAGDVLNPLYHYAFYHGIASDIPTIKFLPDGEPAGGAPEAGA